MTPPLREISYTKKKKIQSPPLPFLFIIKTHKILAWKGTRPFSKNSDIDGPFMKFGEPKGVLDEHYHALRSTTVLEESDVVPNLKIRTWLFWNDHDHAPSCSSSKLSFFILFKLIFVEYPPCSTFARFASHFKDFHEICQ